MEPEGFAVQGLGDGAVAPAAREEPAGLARRRRRYLHALHHGARHAPPGEKVRAAVPDDASAQHDHLLIGEGVGGGRRRRGDDRGVDDALGSETSGAHARRRRGGERHGRHRQTRSLVGTMCDWAVGPGARDSTGVRLASRLEESFSIWIERPPTGPSFATGRFSKRQPPSLTLKSLGLNRRVEHLCCNTSMISQHRIINS